MKITKLAIFIVCAFAVSTAVGQVSDDSEIHGSGTARFIPQFTGSHRLGNSIVFQSANGHIGIGTTTPNAKFTVFDTDNSIFSGLQPVAIYGISSGNLGFTSGVRGDVMSGAAIGVVGVNFNGDSESGGGGVEGLINATNGFNTAIRGTALGTTGPSTAVFGEQFSSEGQAGLFVNRAGGDILHGRVSQNPDITVFRVDGSGTVFAMAGFNRVGPTLRSPWRSPGIVASMPPGICL